MRRTLSEPSLLSIFDNLSLDINLEPNAAAHRVRGHRYFLLLFSNVINYALVFDLGFRYQGSVCWFYWNYYCIILLYQELPPNFATVFKRERPKLNLAQPIFNRPKIAAFLLAIVFAFALLVIFLILN